MPDESHDRTGNWKPKIFLTVAISFLTIDILGRGIWLLILSSILTMLAKPLNVCQWMGLMPSVAGA